jgi:hypothetical protein
MMCVKRKRVVLARMAERSGENDLQSTAHKRALRWKNVRAPRCSNEASDLHVRFEYQVRYRVPDYVGVVVQIMRRQILGTE